MQGIARLSSLGRRTMALSRLSTSAKHLTQTRSMNKRDSGKNSKTRKTLLSAKGAIRLAT